MIIAKLISSDLMLTKIMLESSITDAFINEGILNFEQEVEQEIKTKYELMKNSVNANPSYLFLVAKTNKSIIGTISYGKPAKDIIEFNDSKFSNIGELGTIYIHPCFQNQGVASLLISEMLKLLKELGIREFIFDCGFSKAQKIWIKKFGQPFITIKNYWGDGSDHMLWYCNDYNNHIK